MLILHESLRKRISQYLHGQVRSKMLALQHRLGQCQELVYHDPEKASRMVEEIRAALQSIQEDDIRLASHELYPSIQVDPIIRTAVRLK